MALPIESDVRRVLNINNRGILLKDAFSRAWQKLESFPDRDLWRRKTTRAHLMWEYAVQFAIEALGDDVRVVPHHDTVSFIFDDAILVRMKKADLELKSRNYPTQMALLYHEPDADLFGFEGYQRVEVVYVLNQFETEIDWIGIVARENSKVLWHFEIEDAAPVTELLPFGPTAAARTPADLAKLKIDEDDVASGSEGG